jgi:chromosome segregation ATPase
MATTVKNLETEVELLKKEVSDMAKIHARLDTAIEKIADVSTSLHTIMAVHEEKIIRQEEALDNQEKKLQENIMELHSRITTNAKEQTQLMNEMERRLVDAMKAHNKTESEEFQRLRNDLQNRVGILEKWRHLIIGGAIVIGFILQRLPIWS